MENEKKKLGRKVRKVYALNNIPGLVQVSKAHKTKTFVSLFNVEQAGLSTDESFSWAVICEKHSAFCGFTSLPLAKAACSDPDTFCDECKASLEAAKTPTFVEALHEIAEPPLSAVG